MMANLKTNNLPAQKVPCPLQSLVPNPSPTPSKPLKHRLIGTDWLLTRPS